MHKWENGIGALIQIGDAKLRSHPQAELRMKVTVPALLTPGRKADHRTKDRSAAKPQKKRELAR
jgi:hypothetical protein